MRKYIICLTVLVLASFFAGFWSGDRQLVDEQGNAINFNSALDAANYMARHGWDLEEVFIVQDMTKGMNK